VDVKVIELKLHHDGPRMELRADLSDFPDHPPAKWKANKFNAVQISLDFWGVQEVEILGWTSQNLLSVTVSQPHEVEAYTGFKRVLQCQCLSFRIANVSGYVDASIEKVSGIHAVAPSAFENLAN